MTLTEPADSTKPRLIPIADFATCLIDGKTRAEICALYPGKNSYYLTRFERHLKEIHSIDMKTYVIQHGGITWPKCPGTGRDVGYDTHCGKGLIVNRYVKGGMRKDNHPRFRETCARLSEERQGEGNPMHGRAAWNAGLTVAHPVVARCLAAALVAPFTPARREKMRQASLGKARHTTPHSPETVEKMRRITARRWATGGFNKGATSIHVKMRELLASLPLTEPVVEEHQEVYYSIDFAFPAARVAIECDGDYFHINPAFYPNGPKDAIQRRNAGRDRAKNTFLANRGWTVIRVWECDINAGTFREPLLCRLRESGLLSH